MRFDICKSFRVSHCTKSRVQVAQLYDAFDWRFSNSLTRSTTRSCSWVCTWYSRNLLIHACV